MDDLISSSVEKSESPCSALLERLRDLRKWQSEQRKELLQCQSLIPHESSTSLENDRKEKTQGTCTKDEQYPCSLTESIDLYDNKAHKDNEQDVSIATIKVPHSGSALELISGRNPQVSSPYYLQENLLNSVVKSSLPCHDELDDRGTSTGLEQQSSPVKDTLLSPHTLSLKEAGQEVLGISKACVSPDTYPDKEDLVLHHEIIPEKSEYPKVAFEKKRYHQDKYKMHENDPALKLCGLTSFMKHHCVNEVSPMLVHNEESKTKGDVALVEKPKFKFLRRGEGTARFGMKPVKLRPKVNNNKVDCSYTSQKFDKEPHNTSQKLDKECSKGRQSVLGKVLTSKTIIPNIKQNNHPFRIPNRPLHSLQLQKSGSAVVGEAFVQKKEMENLEMVSNENGLQQKTKCKDQIIYYDKQVRKEQEELSAFEKLEELADDSSFSSNASVVVRLLQRGQHSSSSTPVRSPPPTPHLTPILSYVNHEGNGKQRTVPGASIRLLDRLNQADIIEELNQQNQFPLGNISQILEQLRNIVSLESIDHTSITEEGLKTFLESFVDPNSSASKDCISHFVHDFERNSSVHATSTPAVLQQVLPSKPRVHFRPEGVEVLEYELSDEENTLTDTPSIIDDTDLVTTSDLEILAQVDVKSVPNVKDTRRDPSLHKVSVTHKDGSSLGLENTPLMARAVADSKSRAQIQPAALQFSPPRQPKNSASHYVWSVFGKDKTAKKGLKQPNLHDKLLKVKSSSPNIMEDKINVVDEKVSASMTKENATQQEVDAYKTLLMAKVCELEKETGVFKKKNDKLRILQESVQNERCQLNEERKRFQLEIEREKQQLQEYIDSERNSLWKEKLALKTQSPSLASVREQSLEIVHLKEQLHDLQEESNKKESSHNFAVRRLSEKIKLLEDEIKILKEKNNALQKLEKENIYLKHELDRTKLNRKPVPSSKSGGSTARMQKLKSNKTTSSNISKSLDVTKASKAMTPKRSADRHPPEKETISHLQRSSSSDLRNNKKTPESIEILNLKNIVGFPKNSSEISQESEEIEKDGLNSNVETPICEQENLIMINQENFPKSLEVITTETSPKLVGNLNISCTELYRDDGTQEIVYANGNKKEIFPNGSVIFSYYNGDRKEVHDDRTVYIYGTDLTRHTSFNDGREVLEFPNGQKEIRLSDGSSEFVFSDDTRKIVLPDGSEICSMTDGTVVRTNPEGIKVFEFVSGQREIHTPEEKRREYPDGTIKILHLDGRTETRYKKGRIRIKDKVGNILMDTHRSVH